MLVMEMSSKKHTIPAIRFIGFTNAWEQRKASEIFVSISDKNHPELPILSASQEKGMVLREDIGIDIKYDEKSVGTYKRVAPGQFVIHLRSFQGGFAYSSIEGITSPAYTILDFEKRNEQYSLFWRSVFSSRYFIKRLETVTYGIRDGRSISYADFSTLIFRVPSISEQKRIGDFLVSINSAIAIHQRQMDNYKELKKTSMQKIFNQELRFKDKNGNDYPVWQKKKLKDLGKFYSGTGFNDKYQGYLDLSIPFFKVSDMNIASNSKYMVESNNTVDDDICREMKINKITGPAILFAKVGAAIYMERKRIVHNDFLMDNNMMALRINDSVDIEFTYYLCQSLSFSKYAQVGALPSYNASDIGRLHCKLPVISEQKKIAIFLSILDQKVNEAAQKVELFKELKKGLMQQMFF